MMRSVSSGQPVSSSLVTSARREAGGSSHVCADEWATLALPSPRGHEMGKNRRFQQNHEGFKPLPWYYCHLQNLNGSGTALARHGF